MLMDMFVDTWIRGFQIACNTRITKVKIGFVGILSSWIVLLNEIHEIKCPKHKNDFTIYGTQGGGVTFYNDNDLKTLQ